MLVSDRIVTTSISTEELIAWLDEKRQFILIDTSIPEEYEAEHIPTAKNACVYEVTFLERIQDLAHIAPNSPGSNPLPLVVYGTSGRSCASATAADKLAAAGYENIRDYRGGLEEWRDAGGPTEGTHKHPKPPVVEDRVYSIDPSESQVKWTGRNLNSEHSGTVAISSGTLAVSNQQVVHGEIMLDMTSIQNTDIDDPSMRALLSSHLKSDDFFDVDHFPTAQVLVKSVDELPDATPGSPTHRVHCALTLKGVTRDIDFPAQIGPTDEQTYVARANFDIDRTQWRVIYGSGKFYEKLGKHLVSDIISLSLKIVAH